VAVKIKLKRLGKIRNAQYRIVVADSRTKRDGRAIEEIGLYHPKEEPSLIQVDGERAQYWLSVGAQPTEAVLVLLKITGDWQKFKGLPGAEGTLRVAEPRADKRAVFAAAVTDAAAVKESEGKAPKPVLAPADAPKAEAPKTEAEPAAEVAQEAAATESAEVAAEVTGTPLAEAAADSAQSPAAEQADEAEAAVEAAADAPAETQE
jgi:small subunit ribosomal protein S16